jgi:hypothetical protein
LTAARCPVRTPPPLGSSMQWLQCAAGPGFPVRSTWRSCQRSRPPLLTGRHFGRDGAPRQTRPVSSALSDASGPVDAAFVKIDIKLQRAAAVHPSRFPQPLRPSVWLGTHGSRVARTSGFKAHGNVGHERRCGILCVAFRGPGGQRLSRRTRPPTPTQLSPTFRNSCTPPWPGCTSTTSLSDHTASWSRSMPNGRGGLP